MILGLDFIVILKKALLRYHMITTGVNGLRGPPLDSFFK